MGHEHLLLQRLGETVRALRKARGWSRSELAQRTGISVRYLADVEAGTANPSLLYLLELARTLGTQLPVLLGGAADSGPGRSRRHLALLGLRGAGKSTVGPRLAAELGLPFVELDLRVEEETGLELGELFQVHGEVYYRQAERTALERLLAGPECVVAVGGGLVAEPASFALLRGQATSVWLRATPEDHWQRVLAQGDTRPMADNERAFADLRTILATREPLYRQADLTVDTSGRTVEDVVVALRQSLAEVGFGNPASP